MIVAARIIPVRLFSTYEGNKDGNAYSIGTWIVKSIVDGKEFSLKAFQKEHSYLQSHIDVTIDCELSITGKPWQDKYFNEIQIQNIANMESGVEATSAPQTSSAAPIFNPLAPNAEDLPFK